MLKTLINTSDSVVVVVIVVVVVVVVVVDRFHTALFSALQQTHCALAACEYKINE